MADTDFGKHDRIVPVAYWQETSAAWLVVLALLIALIAF